MKFLNGLSSKINYVKHVLWKDALAVRINKKINKQHTRTLSGLSYYHCPDGQPLVSETIGQLLDWSVNKYEDREAYVSCHQGIRKTYGQFLHDVNKCAAGLLSLNLNVGDRVGIWSSNRYEWVVVEFACFKTGLIMVPLNPANQVPELEYCLKKMQMKALVVEENYKTQDFYKLLSKAIPEVQSTKPDHNVESQRHPFFKTLIMLSDNQFNGAYQFKDVIERGDSGGIEKVADIQRKLDPDSAAAVMFTSGTTGAPKGATLTHFGLVNVSLLSAKRCGYDKEVFRMLCCPLLFHGFGSFILAMNAIASGGCLVLASPGFSPGLSLQAIQNERCNFVGGTPTMFFDMLNHPDEPKMDLTSLKRIKMAGAYCPPNLLLKIRQKWKCDTMVAYGMTETAGFVTGNKPKAPPEEPLVSAGPPYEHLEVKIVDNNDAIVPRGTSGEICIRGYRVMKGYWDDEQKTKESICSSGWYHSGDVGIMNENGTFQIVDRKKDMILRGGENIYPKEIEDCLLGYPKIAEAYVIAVPSERLGEEVCAWIKCNADEILTENEVQDYCKKILSKEKIPRYIRFVNEFPRTLSGKVQKNVLRKIESDRMK
ncbi:hypothetical protein CHUAL_013550 [Chamberlinius hualienensis]